MNSFIILGIIIVPVISRIYLLMMFNKYRNINCKNSLSGCEIARQILDKNGLKDVHIVETKGTFSDHYDPKYNVIRLSKEVFHKSSLASCSIAAYQSCLAIKHQDKNQVIYIKNIFKPILKYLNYISLILLLSAILFQDNNVITLAISLLAITLLFSIITLPVEIFVCKLSYQELTHLKLLTKKEKDEIKFMFKALIIDSLSQIIANIIEIFNLVKSKLTFR